MYVHTYTGCVDPINVKLSTVPKIFTIDKKSQVGLMKILNISFFI